MKSEPGGACCACTGVCVCVCWAGGKEMQFSRKNREPWTGFLDTEPEITLSKPLHRGSSQPQAAPYPAHLGEKRRPE